MNPSFDFDAEPATGCLFPEPAAAKTPAPFVPRSFYRCADCLSVVATTGRHNRLQCGACEGQMEYMGNVTPAKRLAKTVTQCACDDRCTQARGPSCDCHCGGRFHGSKLTVTVTKDAGPVPVANLTSKIAAQARAAEYHAARTAASKAISARYKDVFDRKSICHLSSEDFALWREGQEFLRAFFTVCSGRTHQGRLKGLRSILDRATR